MKHAWSIAKETLHTYGPSGVSYPTAWVARCSVCGAKKTRKTKREAEEVASKMDQISPCRRSNPPANRARLGVAGKGPKARAKILAIAKAGMLSEDRMRIEIDEADRVLGNIESIRKEAAKSGNRGTMGLMAKGSRQVRLFRDEMDRMLRLIERRPNPPKDIDSPKALGDECAVWAISAATGAPVPEVRRAFMDAGEDIWKKRGGQGSGSSMRQIRAVIKKLDWDHKIVGVGASEMFGNGPRAKFADMQSRLFLSGRWEGQIGADQFDVPDQLKEEAARYGTSRAALKATDDMVTVGQLVDQARKDGLALLAVTVNATRARVSAHIVGYSPSRGLYDTSVPTRAAKAAFIHGKADETITGLEWFAHGEDIPGRARRAVLWVFFKGE